jgi:hypothetical protein
MPPAICPVCDLIQKAKVNPEVAVVCSIVLGALMVGESGLDLDTCESCDSTIRDMMGLHQDAMEQGETTP